MLCLNKHFREFHCHINRYFHVTASWFGSDTTKIWQYYSDTQQILPEKRGNTVPQYLALALELIAINGSMVNVIGRELTENKAV